MSATTSVYRLRRRVGELEAEVEALRAALVPFAEMHRESSAPDELACQRGTASDMTVLKSGDFARAAEVLGPPSPDNEYDILDRNARAMPPGDWATAWGLFLRAMRLLRTTML